MLILQTKSHTLYDPAQWTLMLSLAVMYRLRITHFDKRTANLLVTSLQCIFIRATIKIC